jgi:steroid delta-isomerase-like uncharacterized protein
MKPVKILSNLTIFVCIFLLLNPTIFAQHSRTDSNVEHLTQQMFDAWSKNNPNTIDSIFAEDGIYEDVAGSAVVKGRDNIKKLLKETTTAIPDFNIKLLKWFSSGNKVACQWIMTGTQTGNLADLPATGKSFSVRGASIVQIKEGKIIRWTDYYDSFSFLKQLGVIPVKDPEKDN